MKLLFSEKILNIVLRGITIVLKFVLSIIVIKKISIEEYGTYGLFQSTVIILTFIVGFDFYSYSSREILSKGIETFNYYFKNQLIFHLVTYLIILPLSYFLFYWKIVDFKYVYLFILILLSEHISQEVYRMLIVIKKTVAATFVLFIRSGIWVVLLYLFWELNIMEANLKSILVLWSVGAVLSVIIGLFYLDFKWATGFDINWIKKGVIVAIPFFIGTILYKLIEFSGRYFLNYYHSSKEVGVFTFFSSIANILFVFVQTIVIIELFPSLLESKSKSYEKFSEKLKIFEKQIFIYSIIGTVLSLLGIYPLLHFLDKTVLFDSIFSYIILLLSSAFFSFSFVSHYALYSFNLDWKILKATLIGVFFNLVASFLLIPKYGILGAAVSQFISFFMLFIAKLYFWTKTKKEVNQ
tara:strand:+ start:29884 stop:31113 length:1230 start_codon:yes stop_codon:yes gene_type:complete